MSAAPLSQRRRAVFLIVMVRSSLEHARVQRELGTSGVIGLTVLLLSRWWGVADTSVWLSRPGKRAPCVLQPAACLPLGPGRWSGGAFTGAPSSPERLCPYRGRTNGHEQKAIKPSSALRRDPSLLTGRPAKRSPPRV